MSVTSSRIFTNGNSQTVRIPNKFKLDAPLVQFSKNKNDDLVIHPIPEDKGTALFKVLNEFDTEFIELLEHEKNSQPTL